MSMLFKRIKDWAVSITSFRTGDVIPVDGPSGTAKIPYSDLAKEVIKDSANNTAATEADMTADAKLPIMTTGAPKALPANLVAKASVQNAISTGITKVFDPDVVSEEGLLYWNEGVMYYCLHTSVGPFAVENFAAAPFNAFNSIVSMLFETLAVPLYENGYLAADGTVAESSFRRVSDYIDITGYTVVTTVSGIASIAASGNTFACFYDSDKLFISSSKYSSASENVQTTISVPSNAKYVRLTLASSAASGIVERCGKKNIETINKSLDVLKATFKFTDFQLAVPLYENGYLTANGTVAESSYRGVSGYIDVANAGILTTVSGIASIAASGNTFACFYDSDKLFISSSKYSSASNNVQTTISVPSNAKYVRLTLASSASGSILLKQPLVLEALTDDMTSLKGLSKAAMPSEYSISHENGYLTANGTVAESSYRGVSGYIDITGVSVINTIYGIASIAASGNTFACFYDSDKLFISSSKYSSASENVQTTISVPSNAKYVRLTLKGNNLFAAYSFVTVAELQKRNNSSYFVYSKNYCKRVALLGGSVSQQFHSSYRMSREWIADLGISSFTLYGTGGAGYSSAYNNSIQTQADNASADNDVYILWSSGNDYYNQVDVGTSLDYTSDDNYDVSKLTTQCGGMNYCLKTLFDKNPTATIVILTSLPIFQSRAGWIKSSGIGFHNLYDYVQAQKEVAARWGIPCLDQFALCGFNELNYTSYYNVDAGHLVESGYQKIVKRQIEFIANAP